MTRRFRIVDVFTEAPLAGNQLAVVLDAEGLDTARMQAIAREFNFSETTFVLPSTRPGCDLRVRIFTPLIELPMAGHPTVGTTVVLHREGRIGRRATLELGVGPTPVELDGRGHAWMTQQPPEFGPEPPDRAELAAALGLGTADLVADLPAQVVSTGNPFLLVPVVSIAALGRARPDHARWDPVSALLPQHPAAYLFVPAEGDTVRTRLFSPTLTSEDPATGSAAGPLGAYAARHLGRTSLLVEQGVEIGRRSFITVDASGERPRVGGPAVIVAAGELDLP